MPIGYLGYSKFIDTSLGNIFLLTNSTGLNRQVNPLQSTAVWGAGWRNAATTVAYADSQQHFEGGIGFELQAVPKVWNFVRSWAVEDRAYAKSLELSPNGIIVYKYTLDANDPRTGVWLKNASFQIGAEELIKVSSTAIALRRVEQGGATSPSSVSWKTGLKTNVGSVTNPMNPSPFNRNPIPGWNVQGPVTIPDLPAFWSTTNLTGMVLKAADVRLENNTQIIRGCTGNTNPVAILQGTITVDGTLTLWRDGAIRDPFGDNNTTSNFTAANASLIFALGGTPALSFRLNHILLTSDEHNISGPNEATTRNFGFAGVGDCVDPPLLFDAA